VTPLVVVFAAKFRVAPSQSGPLLTAVGGTGEGFMVTDVVAGAELHPFNMALTL
jgi:hypothetical protein